MIAFIVKPILPEAPGSVSGLFDFCRTLFDEGELLEFANLGSYLEFDLFGVEVLNYPFNLEVDMPSDSQRVKAWVTLLSENIFLLEFFSHIQ